MIQKAFRPQLALWVGLPLLGLGGCTLGDTHHQPQSTPVQAAAETGTTSVRWNALARQLAMPGAGHGHGIAMGGRTFALLSVAQLAAAEFSSGDAGALAVAAASAKVLQGLFPAHREAIVVELERERTLAAERGTDVEAAEAEGRAAAARVLARAAGDGYDGVWTGSLRTGEGRWIAAADVEPVGTQWGSVRPWLVRSRDEFRPADPPVLDSDEFREALGEVRRISGERTPAQVELARRWMHPVDGYWNEVAAELIGQSALSEESAARVLVLVNVAVVDAVITGFDTKYHFQYPRPSHVDGTISMAVELPNHPSYVSGHAAVSGAASAVLAHFFPDRAEHLTATAEEIAMSRLYAGVHYRFDNEVGLQIGRAIASRVLEANLSVADLLDK